MNLDSPSILRRYLSTSIDAIFIIAVCIAVSMAFQAEDRTADTVRLATIFIMVFIYEPVCTSCFCTVGQKITGIRVRSFADGSKISILSAYVRIVIKGLLGLFSLLAITFNEDRRAIHDFAADSIVIMNN